MYICCAYISPCDSKLLNNHKNESFDKAESQVERCELRGKVLVSDDLTLYQTTKF